MVDYSQLSDEELKRLYEQHKAPAPEDAPVQQDLSSMSDEDLKRAYEQSKQGEYNQAVEEKNPYVAGAVSALAGAGHAVPFAEPIAASINTAASYLGASPEGIDKSQSIGERFSGARKAQHRAYEALKKAHPMMAGAGEIGGLLGSAYTAPMKGLMAGENLVAGKLAPYLPEAIAGIGSKMGAGALSGAGLGALYSAGEAEGGLGDMAKQGLQGAKYGLIGGAAAPVIGKAAETVADTVKGGYRLGKNLLFGKGIPEEAARRAEDEIATIAKEAKKTPAGLTRMDPRSAIVAPKYGQQAMPIDVLGQPGIASAKHASLVSPEAKAAIEGPLKERNIEQFDRLNKFVTDDILKKQGQDIFSDEAKNAIRENAKEYIPQAYKDIYKIYEGGVHSPNLDNIVQYSTIQKSIPKALNVVNDSRIKERLPELANPFEKVDGKWRIRDDASVPLELWDQIKRQANNFAESNKPTFANPGNRSKFAAYSSAASDLTKELKTQAPLYGDVLGGAQKYLGEENAWNLGSKINSLSKVGPINQAKAALAKLEPQELDYARQAYMQERLNAFKKAGDTANLATRNMNPLQREKDIAVLGLGNASKLHTFLAREDMMNKSMSGLGGSDTVNKIVSFLKNSNPNPYISSGVLGVGEGVYDAFDSDGKFHPDRLLAAFATGFIIPRMAGNTFKIKEQQAKIVADMLVSKDPAVLRKVMNIVENNPQIADGISRAAVALNTIMSVESARAGRASGGKVDKRDYPAKRLSRMEKAVLRAQKAIADETKPIMELPDAHVAHALEIAKDN